MRTLLDPAPVCPVCGQPLTDGLELVCADCDLSYPVLAGSLPLLVSDPATYLTGERALLEQLSSQNRQVAEAYRGRARAGGPRAEVLRSVAMGLDHNAALWDRIHALLPARGTAVRSYTPPPASDLLGHLRRDWSGAAEAEREVGVILAAVGEALERHPVERLLVLGAGAGRILACLAERYPFVTGLDLSCAMGLAFTIMSEEGALSAYNLIHGNFHRAADECERFTAQRTLSSGQPRYIIADAGRIPFGEAVFDAVCAIYFTDLVPLSRLLPEIHRVLGKHGRFIHFGPLGYAFDDVGEYYAVDQLSDVLASHGFSTCEPRYVHNTYFANANRLNDYAFDNLVLEADRS